MLARVPQTTMFVMVILGLSVAGTRDAAAQALCPATDATAIQLALQRAPVTTTVEADLGALGEMPPGGTWRMPVSPGIAPDGLAIEGVALTRSRAPGLESTAHGFDVVVDLRASDRILVTVELVLIDGERSLTLGTIKEIPVRCEAKSASLTVTISDRDFESFFAGGKTPRLLVKRTSFVGGC